MDRCVICEEMEGRQYVYPIGDYKTGYVLCPVHRIMFTEDKGAFFILLKSITGTKKKKEV